MRKSHLDFVFAMCAASTLVLLSGRVGQAEIVNYVIDSSQSTLTLSGAFAGLPFEEQVTGSLTTNYSGAITADLSAGVLTFSGGSSIVGLGVALDTYRPATSGEATNVDNYGIALSVTGLGVIAEAALRDIELDLVSGTVTNNVVPDTLGITILNSVLTYEVYFNPIGDPFSGEDVLTDEVVNNTKGELASLTNDGLTETLIIPFLRTSIISGDNGDIEITLDGELYATRAVPEPSTWLMMGLGLLGLVAFSRRKLRR